MKKLMVIAMCLGFAYGASAQRGHSIGGGYHGGGYLVRPRISVGIGYYSPFYSPFGYYGYPYWGFPYGSYYPYGGAYGRPSKLQKKEADIRSDYADRIYSVRHDNSLTSKQKRQAVRSLKKERSKEIHDLVANYHRQPVNP
ncbi:MAG TPA: hypothetical protein VIL90_11590 [Puia sp.]|jgi:hypothetical protein